MAYTYAQLKAAILAWGWNESAELEAELSSIISHAESRVARDLDLRAQRKTITLPVDGLTGQAALPADILALRLVRDPTTKRQLDPALESLMDLFATEAGTPKYYCHTSPTSQSGAAPVQLRVAPAIASFTQVEIIYTQNGPVLSDTNPTTWLSTNAPDLLLYACLVETAAYLSATDTEDQFNHKRLDELYGQRLDAMRQIELVSQGRTIDALKV